MSVTVTTIWNQCYWKRLSFLYAYLEHKCRPPDANIGHEEFITLAPLSAGLGLNVLKHGLLEST